MAGDRMNGIFDFIFNRDEEEDNTGGRTENYTVNPMNMNGFTDPLDRPVTNPKEMHNATGQHIYNKDYNALDMSSMNAPMGLASTGDSYIQPEAPTEEPGFLDKAGDFFGDEERMARITIALNSMRLNPDASIATSMENKIKSIRSKKKGNSTAEALRKMGRTDLADLVESGVMDGKTAYGLAFKPVSALQEKIDLYTADPEKYAQMVKDGVISAGGVNINMGDKTNMEFTKSGIAQASKLIAAGYTADDTLSDLALLRTLGENPILNEVPNIARGFIPTGLSEAIDAYTAVLERVAKGQRQAGEGVMTEKDFEVLKRTSGDIATSIASRRIVQSALEEVNKRTSERAKYATQFMSQQISLAQFYEKTNALRNRPMFTADQLSQINSLDGMMSYGALNDNETKDVSKDKWNKMTMVQKEAFIKARGN